jgi:hypothetical protein
MGDVSTSCSHSIPEVFTSSDAQRKGMSQIHLVHYGSEEEINVTLLSRPSLRVPRRYSRTAFLIQSGQYTAGRHVTNPNSKLVI